MPRRRLKRSAAPAAGPSGGLRGATRLLRRWRWQPDAALCSAPLRCKPEQWFQVRAVAANGLTGPLVLRFERSRGEPVARRVELEPLGPSGNLIGWVQAPARATQLRMHLPDPAQVGGLPRIDLHVVAEHDPIGHPPANIPVWSALRPPFEIRRIVVPTELAALSTALPAAPVRVEPLPRDLSALANLAHDGACIIDSTWVRGLDLRLADLERLATRACVLLDLETFARLAGRARLGPLQTQECRSLEEIMAARVEYCDFATRGCALQDVVPYATIDDAGRFRTRFLRAGRDWKRHADQAGFATLLSSEAPWERLCKQVLSAARPVGRGELIITDLPWLVGGQRGRLAAPRIARHLLAMHLGQPCDDWIQFWTTSPDTDILVRDLADLARRYPPLRAVRWADDSGAARLGIALPAATPDAPHVLLRTGRADLGAPHDGVSAEPLAIFMKLLARAAAGGRRRSALAVTWQFDVSPPSRYALSFPSAQGQTPTRIDCRIELRRVGGGLLGSVHDLRATSQATTFRLDVAEGLCGDGSLEYCARLSTALRQALSACERP